MSNISDEPISPDQAGYVLVQTMNGPEYGWIQPALARLLNEAHIHAHGQPVACTWYYNPDVNRWFCDHKYSLLHMPMMHVLGAWRN